MSLKDFYNGEETINLAIACYGEPLEGFSSRCTDYDIRYENDGMSYIQLENTKTEVFVFGVCWVNNYFGIDDCRTFYGADTELMGLQKGTE